MVNQFHNFAGAVDMSDAEINRWLIALRNKFFAGKKYYSISAGDSVAIMLAWANSVDFVVSNSCGYSRATFYGPAYSGFDERKNKAEMKFTDDVMDDFTELKNWKPDYVRPGL